MFGRCYKLHLYGGGIDKTYTELDIRFNIRKNCYFICDAKIEILNPTREVMNQFTAHVGMYKESTNERRVTLSIGWLDEGGPVEVFDGVVMSAMPSSYPPDIWLSMQCIGRAYGNTDLVTDADDKSISIPSKNGVKMKFREIISQLTPYFTNRKFTLENRVTNNDILDKEFVNGFSSNSKMRDVMQQIKQMDKNLHVYADNTKVLIEDRRKDGSYQKQPISKDFGMIGLPRCNWPNYFVETLLRTDIDLFKNVIVNSEFNLFSEKGKDKTSFTMSNSGVFRVMGITYNGQFRSGKWAMSLDLLQIDEAKKDLNKQSAENTDSKIKGVKK